MSIRLSNIRLPIEMPEAVLAEHLAERLGVAPQELAAWRILRKSLDVRNKRAPVFVYSAEVRALDQTAELRLVELARQRRSAIQAELFQEPAFEMPPPGQQPLPHRPLVVGSGPAGLIAAYFLALEGYAPLVLERGRAVRERIADVRALEAGGPLDPESNYLFGEGGAGTFSDGKLTCRNTGPDVRRVLELLAESKGKPSILYDHRPHLGSNRLPAVVKSLRQQIERLGGELRFSTRVEDLDLADGRLRGVMTSGGYIPAEVVVLAIGHSARDTYEMLWRRGVPLEQKPFQFGLRIEHPQENVNRAQYGEQPLEALLGAADYSLIAHGPPDVFTFCMCAGGQVIPSVSEPGFFCTNGMSLSRRAMPLANSGLMVTIRPEDFGASDPLAGMRLQREYERRAYEVGQGEYRAPIQRAADFLAGRTPAATEHFTSSYERGLQPYALEDLLPPLVGRAIRAALPQMDRRWQGRFLAEATLLGPEARGSAPLRMSRDPHTLQCPTIVGLYPVGEGAGYAGGIVSAAVDGLRAAKSLVATYQRMEAR